MTRRIDVELAMKRTETLRKEIAKAGTYGLAITLPGGAKLRAAADLELLLETLHEEGFAYER